MSFQLLFLLGCLCQLLFLPRLWDNIPDMQPEDYTVSGQSFVNVTDCCIVHKKECILVRGTMKESAIQ